MKLQKVQSNPAITFRGTVEENIVVYLGKAIEATVQIDENDSFISQAKEGDEPTVKLRQDESLRAVGCRESMLDAATGDNEALTSLVNNWQRYIEEIKFKIGETSTNLLQIIQTSFKDTTPKVSKKRLDEFFTVFYASARKNSTINVAYDLAMKLLNILK
jgi:hypothetical protein